MCVGPGWSWPPLLDSENQIPQTLPSSCTWLARWWLSCLLLEMLWNTVGVKGKHAHMLWALYLGLRSLELNPQTSPTIYSIPALISEPVITTGQKWFRQLQLCSISHCPLGKRYPKSPLPPSSSHLQICFQCTSLSSPVDPLSQKFPKYDTQHIN